MQSAPNSAKILKPLPMLLFGSRWLQLREARVAP
jgi:hypothetical protein